MITNNRIIPHYKGFPLPNSALCDTGYTVGLSDPLMIEFKKQNYLELQIFSISHPIIMKTLTSILLPLLLALAATQPISQVLSENSLALTIYNNNFGVVKDVRTFRFRAGRSSVDFTDVASTILPETVTFTPTSKTGSVEIEEQNFQNNLASKYSLLKDYIGKDITLYVSEGQTSKTVTGTLLSYSPAFLIKTSTGINIFDVVQGVSVPSLPTGLLVKPTLLWKVNSNSNYTTQCQVSYRATGFSWAANYIATLNEAETEIDFVGWVTIDNRSGKRYQNSKIKLIAGDVNIAQPQIYRGEAMYAMSFAKSAAPSFSEQEFGDYHMYTLSRNADVSENEKKQIEFIPLATNIKVDRYLLLRVNVGGYTEEKIQGESKLQFTNTKNNELGIPLPAGKISVNKRDTRDGSLEFIGEDSIGHTPSNENVTIKTGRAFDLVANKVADSRVNIDGGYNATLTLEVKNRARKPYTIEFELNNPYGDNARITQGSTTLLWGKKTANQYVFRTTIAANSSVKVTWTETYRNKGF